MGGYEENPAQQAPDDQIAKQGVVTEVDIDALEACPPWLEGLKSYIEERLIPSMSHLYVGNQTDGDHSVSQLIFGKFDGADQVAGKHKAYYEAVLQSYRQVAKSLQDAADGTRGIIEKYKTVEERNRASAADIERAFGQPPTSDSTTQQTSSTSSTTTNPAALRKGY